MRLYYSIDFENKDIKQKGCCFDAIAFTSKDGARYSLDIAGWNDYSVDEEKRTYEGRVKWDHEAEIINLDIDDDYKDISDNDLINLLTDITDIEICIGYYDELNNDDYTDLDVVRYDICFCVGDTEIRYSNKQM